jgi:hypothetical protein
VAEEASGAVPDSVAHDHSHVVAWEQVDLDKDFDSNGGDSDRVADEGDSLGD